MSKREREREREREGGGRERERGERETCLRVHWFMWCVACKEKLALVNMGLPWCVTNIAWSQSKVMVVLWNDSFACFKMM